MAEVPQQASEAAAKREKLFELLLKKRGIQTSRPESIPRRAEAGAGRATLSFAQQRLWFLDQLEPGNSTYNTSAAVRLLGELNLRALRMAFDEIVRRHEILRTTFAAEGGEAVQVIHPPRPLDITLLEPSEPDEEGRREAARRVIRDEVATGFDLERGPLMRVRLVRVGEREHVLVLVMHHIITDGGSTGVLVRELKALYAAYVAGRPSPLPELPIQYADFAVWQRGHVAGEALEAQLDYWKAQLGGSAQVLDLPTDRPRPEVFSGRGASEQAELPADMSAKLNGLARAEGTTLFTLMLAAFKALLFRYTGEEQISVGAPVAGRSRAELEPLIGYFINTLVMRTDLSGDPAFRELLRREKEVALGAHAHQDVPFEKLVEELHPQRDLSRTPLFQVMFDLQPALQEAEQEARALTDFQVRPVETENEISKFDLTLAVTETREGLAAELEYSTDLFEAATIRRMLRHLESLLAGIVADPDTRLSRLPLLSGDERCQLLVGWNDTAADYGAELSIRELFEEQAARRPGAAAVVCEDGQLSYGELEGRANRLACHLQSLGAGPETVVGVCLERSLEMVVAVLGVLKAGAAYLPLDTTYPPQRLAFMCQDARASLVITTRGLAGRLGEVTARPVLLDDERQSIDAASDEPPASSSQPDNLAYVIYTSGSTGVSKGVQITHRAISNYLRWMQRVCPLGEDDRELQLTPLSFDVSVYEIFGALCAGARLVLARPGGQQDSEYVVEAVKRHGITSMSMVPSALKMLLATPGVEECRSLRRVFCGGEVMPPELPGRFYAALEAELYNAYGPTEAAIDTTIWKCAANEAVAAVPIGRPVGNARVYVLDARIEPVPAGVVGELYISGQPLARGYLNRPALTAERFVPDLFSETPGGRLYRSGDLARYLPDGRIDYVGRADQQVKLRGYRIELGEIEAVLGAHESVSEAAVVVDESGVEKRLVAYVSASAARPLSVSELRGHARARLPEYMVPAAFVVLDELPLTPSGKLDRKALPEPGVAAEPAGTASAPVHTPTEEILAAIWSEVLRKEVAGVEDNFFDLGGHSLLATQAVARARAAFGVEIPLMTLFEAPTVAGLAERVEGLLRVGDAAPAPSITRARRDSDLPLSFSQERLWFLHQLEPDGHAFNMPSAARFRGPLDIAALEQTLTEVVRRHEVLRTVFASVDGRPVQVIKPEAAVKLERSDLSHLDDAAREAAVRRLVEEEARRPFDLSADLMLRAGVIRLGDDEHLILLTMHHIASDGWSVDVLMREVAAIYAALATGRPSPLQDPAIQYADYAVWQRGWLQGEVLERQLDYWRRQLKETPVLELSTDNPRPAAQSFRGRRAPILLDEKLTGELRAFNRREGATLFMTLLAAWQTLLARYTGQEDICVGSYSANRNRAETEGLIGYFINNLALRTDLSGNPTFHELVGRVREVALGAYMHQDVPLEMVLEAVTPERDASRSRLFQVAFVLQNTPSAEVGLPGVALEPLEAESRHANFDLTLWMWESESEIGGALEYNTDLFNDATAARMIRHFETLLTAAINDPQRRIGHLPLLDEAERRRMLYEWNGNVAAYDEAVAVHELFEAQAARQPEAEAVVFEAQRLTYGALNERANQLARYLRARGVGPETRVGICMGRSVEMAVAVLAVLKAGGAYVPLDPAYPRERLAFMLEDSRAQLLLTQRQLLQRLGADAQTLAASARELHVIDVGSEGALFEHEDATNLARTTSPGNLAYVIYTSGSTRRPRGVMIRHGSLAAAFAAWEKAYSLSTAVKCNLQTASFAFDVFTGDIVRVLCSGGKLVICPEESLLSPPELYGLMRREGVECLEVVPSILRHLVEYVEESRQSLDFIRLLVSGADAIYVKEFERIRTVCGPQTRLVNTYGLTEATIDSTYFEKSELDLAPGRLAPIGRPFANTRLYLLDRNLQPVPVGVTGELYVGGPSLARGYLNNPALTAEKFIPDPFGEEPGARLYKAGDLARYLDDGNVEFLGRVDFQVKVRGFRIELGEVEAVLGQHPDVRQVVVAVRAEQSGDNRLVAYVVPHDIAPPVQELQQLLKAHLPAYMMPSAFVMLDELPLSPNGKVDRKALPAPDPDAFEDEDNYVEPATPIEEALAAIWQEVLGRKRIGVNDNFFDAGGHSLLATQVISRARKAFVVELPLRSIFESPTIAELAETIELLILDEIEGADEGEAE